MIMSFQKKKINKVSSSMLIMKTSLLFLNLMNEHVSHPLGIHFGKSDSLAITKAIKIQDATN